jgi:mannose-6-phosphate isomerase-like protein (cupin superfamily)
MKRFSTNIEEATLENGNFRKVLYTSKHSQLVLMSLKPREEIGMEVHEENDQFFRFEKGQGKCIIDGNEYEVGDGFAVVVPAGAQHNVINTSKTEDLKLYTIYSPAHHKDGIVRRESYTMDCGQPAILSIQNVPTLMCISGNVFVQSSEDNEM